MAAKKKTAAKKKSPAKKSAPKKQIARGLVERGGGSVQATTLDSGIPDRSSVPKDVITTPDSGIPDRSDVPKTHAGTDSGIPA